MRPKAPKPILARINLPDVIFSKATPGRNGQMRAYVNQLISEGNFAEAARVEGMRSAEQMGRLIAKGKLHPNQAFDSGGFFSTTNNATVQARKNAINSIGQFYNPGTSSVSPGIAKDLPAHIKARFGINSYGDFTDGALLNGPTKKIFFGRAGRNVRGSFEGGYGSSYSALADRVYDGRVNPIAAGIRQVTGQDPLRNGVMADIYRRAIFS